MKTQFKTLRDAHEYLDFIRYKGYTSSIIERNGDYFIVIHHDYPSTLKSPESRSERISRERNEKLTALLGD